MDDKCFCHLNGFRVKDAVAQKKIDDVINNGAEKLKAKDGTPVTVWIGTKEQYDAITEKQPNCLYMVTGNHDHTDILAKLEKLTLADQVLQNRINALTSIGAETDAMLTKLNQADQILQSRIQTLTEIGSETDSILNNLNTRVTELEKKI